MAPPIGGKNRPVQSVIFPERLPSLSIKKRQLRSILQLPCNIPKTRGYDKYTSGSQAFLCNCFFLAVCFNMVSIDFCPQTALLTNGTVIECKVFRQSLFGLPSDRHMYQLKCYMNPIRYNQNSTYIKKEINFINAFRLSVPRLPYLTKNFYKYIR